MLQNNYFLTEGRFKIKSRGSPNQKQSGFWFVILLEVCFYQHIPKFQ